jgi:hypothetical protein
MRPDGDQRVRLASFQWLRAQMDVHGDVLPRSILAEGFLLDGIRVPLIGPQGIFKPGVMREARCRSRPFPEARTTTAWARAARSEIAIAEAIPRIRTTADCGGRWSGNSR